MRHFSRERGEQANRPSKSKKQKPYGPRVLLNIPDFKALSITTGFELKETPPKPPSRGQAPSLPEEEEKQEVYVKVENPWISEISRQKTLEQAKGRPARHLEAIKRHEKIIPTRDNEASFRLDEQAMREPTPEEAPGSNISKTKQLLTEEYASLSMPANKSSRDVSYFDVWIEETTPKEWVDFYKGKEGPHAYSPMYLDGEIDWVPVHLEDYDLSQKRFEVIIDRNEQRKKVERLAIRFNDEDEAEFEKRVAEAKELQGNYEADQRFIDFVDLIPSQLCSQLRKDTKAKILKMVYERNLKFQEERFVPLLKHLMAVVDEEFVRAMKKCIVLLKMQDKANDPEFIAKKIRIRRFPKVIPEKGVITIPEYSYYRIRKRVIDTHWYRVPEIVQVNKVLAAKSDKFLEYRFLETKNLQMPLELRVLYNTEKTHFQTMNQQIGIHWREFLISETQDKMAENFNFFAVDSKEYEESELRKVLRRIDLVMNSNIRQFARQSISDWVEFLQGFHPPQGDQCYLKTDTPLVILELTIAKSSRKKKEEPKEDETGIDYKPTIAQTYKFMLEFIDWIIEGTNRIANLECDLVPFMKVPKEAVYELKESNKWVVWAKEEITRLLDTYSEGASELLVEYQKFEWIAKMNIKEYMAALFKENPSVKRLREEIENLKQAKDDLVNVSNRRVKFDLFEVRCEKFKDKMNKTIEKAMNTLLQGISSLCQTNTEKLHNDYEEICVKVKKIPTNEDELFHFKEFAKNIRNKKMELEDQEKAVIDRTLILEDYCFELDENVSAALWQVKALPTEVEIASKEGMDRLEIEEEKFRDKLEKEKDFWYKQLNQLYSDFEVVQQFGDYSEASKNYEEVKRLEEALMTAKDQLDSFNQREKLFDLQLSDNTDLLKMIDDFKPFNTLWTNINDFKFGFDTWMTEKKIHELNATEISTNVDKWLRECFMLNKKLLDKSPEAINAINKLKEHLMEFQENIPLIKAISNEAWTEDHWGRLCVTSGIEPNELDSKHETVESLVRKGMMKFIVEIEEISYKAQREFKLKKKLMEMKKEAEQQVLDVIPYKDTFIFRTIEEIESILDEQVVNIQAMKTSPYAKPIERECKEWEERLLDIQETLEQWMKCESVWMNLEPIFSSDDIQKRMPMEYRQFRQVDTSWKQTMETTEKESALLEAVSVDGSTLVLFKDANKNLDEIQKSMHQYLETKRLSFPRFFFLSDEDLLDILSQTKDPLRVQAHLNKCFEAIDKVTFTPKLEVTQMISPEKETIDLMVKIDVNEGDRKGNVEFWMGDIEKTMYKTIQDLTQKSLKEYREIQRTDWAKNWPSMVTLCVDEIEWTYGVEEAIKTNSLANYEKVLSDDILEIVKMVRGKLESLTRKTLSAMITIDVHARDIVTQLKNDRVEDQNQFAWIAQLRYYLSGKENVIVKMVNSSINFGFEYLGNTPRLVITPLTDRCYRTLIGAYNLFYGGAPEGPAGTGKTESVKDLAKAVAVKCVVFNCSDTLDYVAMGKFFKGLASSGSWCCFDEFNRIEPEVLSVIAMQVLEILQAVRDKRKVFVFEGTQLNLVHSCAINITMNPGYAGRSELPDNLKALFRPCAMMVPDYGLISEISLFSYGFADARFIATKVVASLQLSSEQLSTQGHYDFGMRAVKAILTACGNLKIRYPEQDENILALRALNDVNVPKFTSNDIPLFKGITSDLFPGVALPEIDYGELYTALDDACLTTNLEPTDEFKQKCIQLYETISVRHGLMLVGQTFSGKTEVINTLQLAMSSIPNNPEFAKTVKIVINPKAVTMTELYGKFIPESHQWNDGVISSSFRIFTAERGPEKKWVLFDGPVDSKWIESMNTVLDDNKMLCLASGEVIKLTDTMTMMFEVEDLVQASPATVSRCGMVFLEPHRLGWEVLIQSFVNDIPYFIRDLYSDFILDMFIWFAWPLCEIVRKKCKLQVPVTDNELVMTSLNLFDCFLSEYREMLKGDEPDSPEKSPLPKDFALPKDYEETLKSCIFFSIIWGFGGVVDENTRSVFREFMNSLLDGSNVKELYSLLELPESWEPRTYDFRENGDYFDLVFSSRSGNLIWMPWTSLELETYNPDPNFEYHEIIVPTKDTLRISYIMEFYASRNKHVMFCGFTGTSKTVCVLEKLRKQFYNETWTYAFMAFSAQTSANKIQLIMEGYMEKRSRHINAPAGNRRMIIFVDDLNMPSKEEFGAQPPIELLREWMDHEGWYDLETKEFKKFVDIQFIACMGPPGGGRNSITQRYVRHFNKLYIEPFDEESLELIFSTIVQWFFSKQSEPFASSVQGMKDGLVNSTIHVFTRISNELLPTPAKIHYIYNLRDMSKVFQGISQSHALAVPDEAAMVRLWIHECQRVFEDRLINDQDRAYFVGVLKETTREFFRRNWEDVVVSEPILFGSFVPIVTREEGKPPVPDIYCEFEDKAFLNSKMEDFLEYYNEISETKMKLVLFMAAVEHVVKIVRIIQQPLGNALLLGVGGSGRKSLTMLAISIAEFSLFEVEISQNFGMNEWREKLRLLFQKAGLENTPTVFLFSDTQISNEGFLEDINNLLNNGEVPNLFENEERENVLDNLQEEAVANKKGETAEAIYAFFIEKVRQNLHLALCLSPIGESFRTRLRMFPSLVNCCTIDWFLPWPEDALRSVAMKFLDSVDVEEEIKTGLVEICVDMQERVTSLVTRYREEMRRYYYVTPTSYLELINTFQNLINTKREGVKRMIQRYEGGLEKLLETASKVSIMQKELEELQPKLETAQIETKAMMADLTVQQEEAQIVQTQCEKDQALCTVERETAQGIKAECEERLEEALPTYRAALKALKELDRNQIDEVKSMKAPPPGVRFTMEAMCKIMLIDPIMVAKKSGFGKEPDYWETAKKFILNRPRLMDDLENFDKDNIDPKAINNVESIINHPDFVPEKIRKSSVAACGLSMWIRAMYRYDKIMKEIRPKQAALKEAEERLRVAEADLAEKMENLRNIQEHVAKLQADYDAAVEKEKKLQEDVDMCKIKLERAEKLIEGLKDEKVRWANEAESLKEKFENIIGDLMVSSGIIAYLGVFTSQYRIECTQNWIRQLKEKFIPSSPDFSLEGTLGDAVKIRDWTMAHLPNDAFSIDNAIIMEESSRWPLMIDPQIEANTWIKHMEGKVLEVSRLNASDLGTTLVNSISFGIPVLIENMGETINPELDNVISTKKGTEGIVKIGDKVADLSRDFRLYMTTKLPRPHYSPEICVRVTLLNFMTTEEGLQDQMLALTVNAEAPNIEASRQKCIADSARFKKELKTLEDKILELVSNAQGDILEDEFLIETLEQSKTTSRDIQDQLNKQESIQKYIEETRTNYRPVASRVSQLFFCVADLCNVEPMYQYSLEWYERIYESAIQKAEKANIVQERVKHLNSMFSFLLYENVCRSLFEKDKLLFSLLICLKIMTSDGVLNAQEIRFLLTGSSRSSSKKPNPTLEGDRYWLENKDWLGIEEIAEFPKFQYFDEDFAQHVAEWKLVWQSLEPLKETWPADWKQRINQFQQIMVLSLIRPDKVVPAIEDLIVKELGKDFISPPSFNLEISFEDTAMNVPVVFILSPGVDPISDIEKLALRKGFKNKMTALSLGDGQGPIAEAALDRATSEGGWVVLQNCHLAKSFMNTLEKRVDELKPEVTHPDFRLWLTSMPSEIFPVTILQNSVKITNEPPKGLQKNLLRSYLSYEIGAFEDNEKPSEFKRLVFGLSFFHASIQERRKFGALGWNIPYEFSMSDLSISFYQLRMFLNEYELIPWDALRYMVAEANYGGRVTDSWDRRTISTILEDFYSTDFLKDDYKINDCEEYKLPTEGSIEDYITFINEQVPHSEITKVFGLHNNANITSAINETNQLLLTVLSLQPKSVAGASKTPEQLMSELAESIFDRMPTPFDIEKSMKLFPIVHEESMNTVLIQELIRFNRLLVAIRESTVNLKKAVEGLVTMSADLEKIGNSLFDNKVPESWMAVGYPSLKPLAQWIDDFIDRLTFMQNWLDNGAPFVFWISGFFFTQSFLTGTKQNYARKYQIPIDTLCFDFEVLDESLTRETIESNPEDGCYIHGLFLDGARWSDELKALDEPTPKILFANVPVIWLKPTKIAEMPKRHVYDCPVYKTSSRMGTLSTTGHSTNFVVSMFLTMQEKHDQKHWIKRGAAMLTQLNF